MKSVYILTAISPKVAYDGKKGHYARDTKHNFICHAITVGVFNSIEAAEKTIKTLVADNAGQNNKYGGWETYVGFMLDEHYVNDAIDKHGNISLFESSRSYLSDGSLNCISDCDYRCKKKFNGTDCQNTHIKKGDIALEFNHDILTPVLVEELSMTKDEWKERFKLDVYGDFTDDSGLAFSAYYGHVHPFAPTLFPLSCLPYAKILKADMMKMEKEKNKYFNGD